MLLLAAGIIIFFGIHCVPMKVELRARFIDKIGLIPYKIIFALISVLGIGLMASGRGSAEIIDIWHPAGWLRYAAMMLMFPAVLLVLAAFGPDNSIRRILGHPMILGVEIWAIAHLLVNGDIASILFFGSFLLWALAAFASASRRKPPRGGKAGRLNDIGILIVALVVYIAVFRGHEWIAGVSLVNQ